MLSKNYQAVLRAYRKGYRMVDNEVISPYSGKPLKLRIYTSKRGYKYHRFTIGGPTNGRSYVKVALLAAYQKFGEELFKPGIVVRHIDDDSLNNRSANLLLGTQSDNMFDRSPEDRLRSSVIAATKLRKFTDVEMDEIRAFHNGSYKETMETFGVCKGTLHRILNVEYKTKV